VYAADRSLAPDEVRTAQQYLDAFVSDWTSHGDALCAAAAVFEDRFVTLGLDLHHAGASGCSIDKSVRAIQALESALHCSLTNRLFVWVEQAGAWQKWTLGQVKKSWSSGEWPAETTLADTSAQTKDVWLRSIRTAPENSWLSRLPV
jgi:hypothetical protein